MTETEQTQHLMILFTELQTLIGQENYRGIDSFLLAAHPPTQTPLEMIALLRYTYTARHHLTQYHLYLDEVAMELRSRNMDVERMLAGLPCYSIDRYP